MWQNTGSSETHNESARRSLDSLGLLPTVRFEPSG